MDPLNKKAFLKQLPQCLQETLSSDDAEKQRLIELTVDLIEQKKQHKVQQAEQKGLSKSIGEAKKAGQSIDTIMQKMQAFSATLKIASTSIKAQENELYQSYQALFKSDEPSIDAPKPEAQELPLERIELILCLQKNIPDWNNYVDSNPQASIYHRHETMGMINRAFGHEVYGYMAMLDGKVVGILPIIRQNSRLFGDFMTSVPFFNYGGALAESPAVAELLMKKAGKQAENLGCQHVEFRDATPYSKWPVRDQKVCMVLKLPTSIDALDKQLGTKMRAQIKRPMQANPDVAIGRGELLDDFYQVFAINMRDLGTPVYSKQFFQEVLDTYGDDSSIVVIKMAGKPVSAGFLLGYKEQLEIPWASTLKEANKHSINMLLYWEILRFAIKQGYQQFDFGRSTKGEGTYRFKKQWGAKPEPCYWHYWLPEGESLPALNPNNPKFKLMMAVWQRLPVWLTKILGPNIVKYLP